MVTLIGVHVVAAALSFYSKEKLVSKYCYYTLMPLPCFLHMSSLHTVCINIRSQYSNSNYLSSTVSII